MVKPKKRFGQHFLIDQSAVEKILQAVTDLNPPHVVEVGPGEGVLTKRLSSEIENFIAVEIDSESAAHLTDRDIVDDEQLVNADFLKWPLPQQEFVLVGNFPYNISSQILFRAIDHRRFVTHLIGMFQKEVALRIAAQPGSRTYGILSVMCQAYYNIEYLFDVPPRSFRPPPKVDSAVVRLTRKSELNLACNEEKFRHIVRTAFNQRRKMLGNSLSPIIGDNKSVLHTYARMRPEQLSVSDFVNITRTLYPD